MLAESLKHFCLRFDLFLYFENLTPGLANRFHLSSFAGKPVVSGPIGQVRYCGRNLQIVG